MEHVATGFGIAYTLNGITSVAGLPFAGCVTDYFKSESGSFIFSGCVMMFAALVLCFIKLRHCFIGRCEDGNANENKNYTENNFVVISASTYL
ncbi:hypothetical protein ACF0H5_002303 [Mactra antiquata]